MKNPVDSNALMDRVNRRLAALGLSAAEASRRTGKTWAISNIRKRGSKGGGVNMATLSALAPVLKTSVSWLVSGDGPEEITYGEPEDPGLVGLVSKLIPPAVASDGSLSDEFVSLVADLVNSYLSGVDKKLAEEGRRAFGAAPLLPKDLDWHKLDRETLLEEAFLQGRRAKIRSK